MATSEPPSGPEPTEAVFDEIETRLGEESERLDRAGDHRLERKIEKLEKSREKLQMLLNITRRMNAKNRVNEVLDLILENALAITRGGRAFLLTMDVSGQLEVAAARNADGTHPIPGDLDLSHSSLEDVFRRKKTLFVGDASEDPDFMARRSVRELSLRTIACVPLTTRGEVSGALYVDSRQASDLLEEDGLELLETFAGQAAVALYRVNEHERLEQEAEDLEAQNQGLREALGETVQFDRILGRSPAMKRVFSVLQRVMQNPVTVHLHGETGTGKDLVAQALHFNSPRRDGNFVALNCGAVSQSLLESELFGHAKGAFTGADRDHVGMIERAHEGTLFLDEIGEIPHNLQVSLLRMLQEAKIRRVGESFDRDVDVRIITATHRDLDTELREGRMRQDFFYRINVVTIHLPPLRERDEDILLLAEHFLGIQREKLDRAGLEFSGGAKRAMLKYEWPGNVRELMNRIERASALAETDVIGPSELTLDRSVTEAPDTPRNGALKDILREVEVRVIEQALEESDYVMARAAKKLGMTRQNLYARIRRHGVRTAREIG